jgi:hypothetical protein
VSLAERRLASLAAVFARDRAAVLLSGLSGSRAPELAAQAARCARGSREARLAALAETLVAPAISPSRIARAVESERPRLARLVGAAAAGRPLPAGVSPLLARLALEATLALRG